MASSYSSSYSLVDNAGIDVILCVNNYFVVDLVCRKDFFS